MRIAIFGVGGAAGYFGARLAQAGADVVWVARGAQLDALRTRGLQVESVHGDFALGPLCASDSPADLGRADAVILGVKVWQVRDAARAMGPLLGSDGCIVPLQNGVEAADDLRSVLGDGPTLGGVAKIISLLVGPGHIRHLGGPSSLAFAELDDRFSERVERLRAAFRAAGIAVEVPTSIQAALWEKFLFVASLGGVGAVSRAPIGIVRSVLETRTMLEQAMAEILVRPAIRPVINAVTFNLLYRTHLTFAKTNRSPLNYTNDFYLCLFSQIKGERFCRLVIFQITHSQEICIVSKLMRLLPGVQLL